MQRLPNSVTQIRFGVRGWAAIAVGLVILAAITFLAVGFFILILPVALLAPLLFSLLPKSKRHGVVTPPENPPATQTTVIEGDFKVIGNAKGERTET